MKGKWRGEGYKFYTTLRGCDQLVEDIVGLEDGRKVYRCEIILLRSKKRTQGKMEIE